LGKLKYLQEMVVACPNCQEHTYIGRTDLGAEGVWIFLVGIPLMFLGGFGCFVMMVGAFVMQLGIAIDLMISVGFPGSLIASVVDIFPKAKTDCGECNATIRANNSSFLQITTTFDL